MRKILFVILLTYFCVLPVAAAEITAPEVPQGGREMMPHNTESFGAGLQELLEKGTFLFRSELEQAGESCYVILAAAILCTILPLLSEKMRTLASLAATLSIAGLLLQRTGAMIACASEGVWEILEYGKLLCPVMTTALAAQGGITTSGVLFAGTTAFISLLSTLVSRILIPMVYLFLLFTVAHCGLGDPFLKTLSDAAKSFLGWVLKSLLIVFTTYLSITGVVSGTTDAAALKAAKVTISSVVPVIGGILSDASESVLVSMGVIKNAAGIYGILAVAAVFLEPFVKLGSQYLLLKVSGAVCSLFAEKQITQLVESFAAAMGLLLAMVASGCVLILISTVCFMRGMNG